MATNTEIPVSSTDLSNEGFSTLASKAFDDKLNVNKCYDTPAALKELESLKTKTEAGEVSIAGVTTTLLNDLINECKTASVAQSPQPVSSTPTSNQDYKKGPLKAEIDPNTPFQSVSENQDVRLMAEAVKSNMNLMIKKVQSDYLKHFDDTILRGFGIFTYAEHEHLLRTVTDGIGWTGVPMPFVSVSNSKDADNIVTRGQHGAADVIDNIVSQYGDGGITIKGVRGISETDPFVDTNARDVEIKKMLLKMNEAIKDETGWISGWVVSYLLLRHIGGATIHITKAVTTKGLSLLSIKGKGGANIIHMTKAGYDMLDNAMKKQGGDMFNRWEKLKKTLSFEGATPEAKAEAERNAKQIESGKTALQDVLYERYGEGMSREKFGEALESTVSGHANNIEKAQIEYTRGLQVITKHLPIDLMNPETRLDELKKMALDMPASRFQRFVNKFMYHLFEKGGIEKYTLGKLLGYQSFVGMHNARSREFSENFLRESGKVEFDIGEGHKVSVHPEDVEKLKELIKHIDADVALAAQDAEMKALADVQRIQGEINKLKADNIPDGEQDVAEKIRQLEEAKIKYADFERLHKLAQSARTERDTATNNVKTEEGKLETAKTELEKAKKKVELYKEYYVTDTAYNDLVDSKDTANKNLTQGKQRVIDAISSLEGKITTKVAFTSFVGNIVDIDFLEQARAHVDSIKGDIATYNGSAFEKLDTGDAAISKITSAEGYADTLKTEEKRVDIKELELKTKVTELTDAGIWDPATKSLTKTLKELQVDVEGKEADVKNAEKVLADAQEKLKKVVAGVDKTKADIKNNSSREVINKGTVRQTDGTALSRDIRTQAEIDAKLAKAQEMAAKQVEKRNAAQKVTATEQARATIVTKSGVTADVKPKPDGTHSTGSQSFFDKMTAQQAEVQITYNEYVTRAGAKGYTLEIKEGKATLTDTAGKKLEFDMKDPVKRGEFFKKIK